MRNKDEVIRNYQGGFGFSGSNDPLIEVSQSSEDKTVRVNLRVKTIFCHLDLTQTQFYEIFKTMEEVIEDWE